MIGWLTIVNYRHHPPKGENRDSDEECNVLHRSGILPHTVAAGDICIPGGKVVGHLSDIFLLICRMVVCHLFFI